MIKIVKKGVPGFFWLLFFTSSSFADIPTTTYIAGSLGIFQGSFNQTYLDQTDAIVQNIGESVQQHGYTGGLAVGYRRKMKDAYFIGAELSGNINSQHVTYQSGASTSAFSDSINIMHQYDLTFVPGILLSESVAAYLKLGISFANIRDNLSSPVGFTSVMTQYNGVKNATGFIGALGITKYLNRHFSLFTEATYHDYGRVTFSDFQNFSANYSHTAQVYSYAVQLGAAYHF